MRKEGYTMIEGKIIKDPCNEGVLARLIEHIIHLFIQQVRTIYLKSHRVSHKYLLSRIKGEGMNHTTWKENLGSSSHKYLMEKIKKRENVASSFLEIKKNF